MAASSAASGFGAATGGFGTASSSPAPGSGAAASSPAPGFGTPASSAAFGFGAAAGGFGTASSPAPGFDAAAGSAAPGFGEHMQPCSEAGLSNSVRWILAARCAFHLCIAECSASACATHCVVCASPQSLAGGFGAASTPVAGGFGAASSSPSSAFGELQSPSHPAMQMPCPAASACKLHGALCSSPAVPLPAECPHVARCRRLWGRLKQPCSWLWCDSWQPCRWLWCALLGLPHRCRRCLAASYLERQVQSSERTCSPCLLPGRFEGLVCAGGFGAGASSPAAGFGATAGSPASGFGASPAWLAADSLY